MKRPVLDCYSGDLSVAEAAARLGVTTDRVMVLVSGPDLNGHWQGPVVRIPAVEVAAYRIGRGNAR